MSAKQLLDEGLLTEAVERQTAEVKARPTDLAARTFLFELLALAGDLERAGRQLDALGQLLKEDPQAQIGAALYRRLLDAEIQRRRVFNEGLRPRFLLEPPAEVTRHIEALDLLRDGRTTEARDRLDAAEADRVRPSGTLGRTAFDDFRDADDLLAPVLEVHAPAGYGWIPWSQIQLLEVLPPQSLRDLFWAPARIASFDGQLGEVHLPALYPGSHSHPDPTARLGRFTDWVEHEGGIVRGAGLKTFLVGDDARTLFELTEVHFQPPTVLTSAATQEVAP